VGIAFLGANYIHARSRRFGYFLFAYTGLIFLGSIVLGWHYAIDGYVSLLAVPMIWMLAGKIIVASNRTLFDPLVALPSSRQGQSDPQRGVRLS
jgi:hypothetical protein